MADLPDLSGSDPAPPEGTIAAGVPLARPVTKEHVPVRQSQADDFLLLTSTRRAAWADIGLLAACLVLFELAAQLLATALAVAFIGPECLDPDWSGIAELQRTLLVPLLTLRGIVSVALVMLIISIRAQAPGSVGLRRRGFVVDLPIGVVAAVVAGVLAQLAFLLLWMIWPEVSKQMKENAQRIQEIVPRLRPLGFVGLSVLIGIYEELIFRGFLMLRLRRATGSWTLAVLISTLLFTGLHALDQVTVALMAIAILSLVFSVTTIWRRSVVPAIVAHTLWNLPQFLSLYYGSADTWT